MMRIFIIFYLFLNVFANKSLAQQASSQLQTNGGKNCAEAQLLCNLNITGKTYDNQQSTQSAPHCFYTHSFPEWFRFVAGDTSGTIELIKEFCWNDDNSNALGMAIYDGSSCDQPPIACQSATGDTLQLHLSNLQIGHEYNIMINTYPSTACDYKLYGLGNVAVPPPVAGFSAALQGASDVCIWSVNTICMPEILPQAPYIEWQYTGEPSFVLPAADTCIHIYTQEYGNIQVYARPGNACVFGPWSNKTFEVHPPYYDLTLVRNTIPFETTPLYLPWADDTVPAQEGYHTFYAIGQSQYGCDSVIHIEYAVSSPVDIARCLVYVDFDNNGQYNSGDAVYNSGVVLASSSGQFASTGSNGIGFIQNMQAGDTLYIPSPPAGYTQIPGEYVFFPNTIPLYSHKVGIKPTGASPDLELFHSSSVFRPGFVAKNKFKIKNRFQLSGTSMFSVVKPSWLTFENAAPYPDWISGDTLRWTVPISSWSEPSITVDFRTPAGTPLGTIIDLAAHLEPLPSETNLVNNNLDLSFVVVGSFDPNDKTVEPAYLLSDEFETPPYLTYTIRFQNTGSYPADFVRLIDTLQESLDPATFEFIDASHPCTWRMYGQGIVDFFFEAISLPDSLSDPEGSNGYATFRIKPKGGLEFRDVVQNFADIYFDFNPPIRTNTAETKAVYFIPGETIPATGMRVRPNPAAFFARFSWLTPLPEDGVLRLIGSDGIPRFTETVPQGESSWLIDVQNFPPGMYVGFLEFDGAVFIRQLVIVEAPATRMRN